MLGGLDTWRDGLEQAGVDVLDPQAAAADTPDLAVAPARLADQALESGAHSILLEGSGARRLLESRGFVVRRYLPRPTVDRPDILLPLDQPAAASYAVSRWSAADRRWRTVRNALLARLFQTGRFPELRSTTTVGQRDGGPPFLVSLAGELGIPADSSWFLTLGQGDELSRNVFHLFPAGSPAPAWVLKFARVPGYSDPFDRDERGLRLAETAGGAVARHAPRLLGRFTADGLHALVESAAVGQRVRRVLEGPTSEATKLGLVDGIASWIVELGRATAAEPARLDAERRRLSEEVVPRWTESGAPADLVSTLPPVPAVLQHNDLGSWNIVGEGAAFTAVDWESARAHGLPLWDLLYFLTDAVAALDRVSSDGRDEHAARLFRGGSPRSPLLFAWVRRAVEACDVPPSAVGPIATLCWLHHGLSHVARTAAVDRFAPSGRASLPPIERVAYFWLTDPLLGPGWSRWER